MTLVPAMEKRVLVHPYEGTLSQSRQYLGFECVQPRKAALLLLVAAGMERTVAGTGFRQSVPSLRKQPRALLLLHRPPHIDIHHPHEVRDICAGKVADRRMGCIVHKHAEIES